MYEIKLEGALEDNILALLCWSDKYFLTIRAKIKPEFFSLRSYQQIAEKAFEFIDKYAQPPKRMLFDLLEPQIKSNEGGGLVGKTLDAMAGYNAQLNERYILDSLERFLRTARIKLAIDKAAIAIADDDIVSAESAMMLEPFENQDSAGTFLHQTDKVLTHIRSEDEEGEDFSCAVPVIDRLGIGIRRKTMTILIGLRNVGKSWWLTAIAKENFLQRRRVLHITLEMPEREVVRRYVQSFFAMTDTKFKTTDKIRVPLVESDSLGRFTRIDFESIDPVALTGITARQLEIFKRRPPIMILEFPTSGFTVAQLQAQLKFLAQKVHFVPDLLLIDYPDLMALDPRNLRQDTGRLYKELRGIAGEYNLAMVCPTQANREASRAKIVTSYHISEDFSKAATADNILTISRTTAEEKLKLARIFVDKSRYGEKGRLAVISQEYSIGQFCTASSLGGQVYDAEIARQSLGELEEEPSAALEK